MKIKAIITGTTGMVGKGVLLECLESNHVDSVLIVNRQPIGITHPKLKEIIHPNFFDLAAIKDQFKGYNACYFCLGVSSFRMTEKDFNHFTYDLTSTFVDAVFEMSPECTFTYVSGAGTDSTEKGSVMWARVKGKTENMILNKGFKDAYMFRPGAILPEKGVKSKTSLYNSIYVIMRPLFPFMRKYMKKSITNTVLVGKAMIQVSLKPHANKHLENAEISELGNSLN